MNLQHSFIVGVAVVASLFLAIPAALYLSREYWDRAYPSVEIQRGRSLPARARGNGAMAYLIAWIVAVFAWNVVVDVVIFALAKLPPKASQPAMSALIVVVALIGFLTFVLILVVAAVRGHNERVRRERDSEIAAAEQRLLT